MVYIGVIQKKKLSSSPRPQMERIQSQIKDWLGQYIRPINITLVCIQIAFAYVSFCVIVARPWQWFTTFSGACYFSVFTAGVVLLCWSYYLACTVKPPPIDKTKYVQKPPSLDVKQKKLTTLKECATRESWCKHCHAKKPARTHHCPICHQCIPVRDHHCIWTGNCVGFYNHKAFLLFLLYDVLCLTFALTAMVVRGVEYGMYLDAHPDIVVLFDGHRDPMAMTVTQCVLLLLNLLVTLPVTLGIWSLFITQWSHVSKNMTVNELWEMEDVYEFDMKKDVVAWPFDKKSVYLNFCDKMGSPLSWRWFLPISL